MDAKILALGSGLALALLYFSGGVTAATEAPTNEVNSFTREYGAPGEIRTYTAADGTTRVYGGL